MENFDRLCKAQQSIGTGQNLEVHFHTAQLERDHQHRHRAEQSVFRGFLVFFFSSSFSPRQVSWFEYSRHRRCCSKILGLNPLGKSHLAQFKECHQLRSRQTEFFTSYGRFLARCTPDCWYVYQTYTEDNLQFPPWSWIGL